MNHPKVINKRLALVVVLAGAGMLVGWFIFSSLRHPEFGKIYHAEMIESGGGDSWQTGWEKKESAVRKFFRVKQREAPPQRGLQIGPALLGWSLGGHIYMSNPSPDNSNDPLWEFSLSERKSLEEVTREDLKVEYYGKDDPRGEKVYGLSTTGSKDGPRWGGHAIKVPDGQVFLARLVTNRSVIYVVQLGEWSYTKNVNGAHIGRIRAEYTVAPSPVN